jgi:hypothetical protein
MEPLGKRPKAFSVMYNGRIYVPEALRLKIKRRYHDVPLGSRAYGPTTRTRAMRKIFRPQIKIPMYEDASFAPGTRTTNIPTMDN